MTSSWFALHVKSRQEKIVSQILDSKGFEQFLPVYRSKRIWVDRVREIDLPLFPGYLFCRFSPEARIPVVTTPGVVDIVRCGPMFAPVDPAEIADSNEIAVACPAVAISGGRRASNDRGRPTQGRSRNLAAD